MDGYFQPQFCVSDFSGTPDYTADLAKMKGICSAWCSLLRTLWGPHNLLAHHTACPSWVFFQILAGIKRGVWEARPRGIKALEISILRMEQQDSDEPSEILTVNQLRSASSNTTPFSIKDFFLCPSRLPKQYPSTSFHVNTKFPWWPFMCVLSPLASTPSKYLLFFI